MTGWWDVPIRQGHYPELIEPLKLTLDNSEMKDFRERWEEMMRDPAKMYGTTQLAFSGLNAELTVRKMSAFLPISDGMLYDNGVHVDGYVPPPRPSWRQRMTWRIADYRSRISLAWHALRMGESCDCRYEQMDRDY